MLTYLGTHRKKEPSLSYQFGCIHQNLLVAIWVSSLNNQKEVEIGKEKLFREWWTSFSQQQAHLSKENEEHS